MANQPPAWLRPGVLLGALAGGVRTLLRRWRLVMLLGAASGGLMVFGYFAIGYVVGRVETAERIRLYAMAVLDNGMDWLDRTVRGEAAVRAQAQAWKPFRSELQDLEINSIALSPRPVRAGAMTQLADGLLLATTAHGAFTALQSATADHAPAAIASPLNLEAYRADPLWDVPGNDHNYFRINDILATPRGEGAYTLYATHHWFTKDCIEFRLSRTDITVESGRVRQEGEWRTIFTATPCFQVMTEFATFYMPFSGNLSGGRMLDYDDGRLLMTVGDQQVFEARGVDVAQDPKATMGKILLVDKETGAAAIFATGTRNAQGLLRDSKGRIWSTEHGPHGGDELNLVAEGDNLGWPIVTYGVNYDQRPWTGASVEGNHDRFVRPVYAWLPSVGVSNLVEAPGDAFPNWRGDLLVGSLTGNTLFRVRLQGDDATYAEPIRFGGRAIRDIEVLKDGRIAILDNRMSVLFIRNGAGFGKSRIYNDGASVVPRIAAKGLPAKRAELVDHGATLFGRRCAECHSLVGAAGAGPPLRDVAGRNIASVPSFTYSESLVRAGGSWSEGALARFIRTPESYGAAVAMPNLGLSAVEAAEIAAYLTELRRQDRAGGGRTMRTAESGVGEAAH
ncbi:MAG: PQQ-dependent sugar dehydrogenase [Hyphomonadaceae bacterium]|nr:PQQ-dependent sugar dehydrogenase [Hyphomonadaceae bacterium]